MARPVSNHVGALQNGRHRIPQHKRQWFSVHEKQIALYVLNCLSFFKWWFKHENKNIKLSVYGGKFFVKQKKIFN